jgi:hypothetical protein
VSQRAAFSAISGGTAVDAGHARAGCGVGGVGFEAGGRERGIVAGS